MQMHISGGASTKASKNTKHTTTINREAIKVDKEKWERTLAALGLRDGVGVFKRFGIGRDGESPPPLIFRAEEEEGGSFELSRDDLALRAPAAPKSSALSRKVTEVP